MTTDHAYAPGTITPVFNEQTPKVEPFDITRVDKDFLALVDEITAFANNNEYMELAGLAANQVQKDGKRLDIRLCHIMFAGRLVPALNPTITEYSGVTYRSKEGCLTWPGKKVVANRHETITVKYLTIPDLKETVIKPTGVEATIWQHEIDHLDGKQEEFIVLLAPGTAQKPNDKCACNSGKKHKKCCGRA